MELHKHISWHKPIIFMKYLDSIACRPRTVAWFANWPRVQNRSSMSVVCIFKVYGPWDYFLPTANNSWTNKTGVVILVPTYWLDTTHLCMKFHEFISSSSIVMAPDLKTRPRTNGRGDDSARAVVNRPSSVESFTLQLSRKGALAFISRKVRINMSDLRRVIRKRDCWSQILGKNHLGIYHSCGSFFAEVLMKIILFWLH